ncbi:MAG: PEP/pyruvate-binding domain-containing protein [Candidatus Sericytochromatia bacterium]
MLIYDFSVQSLLELAEVGGKGLSLMRMTAAGLQVPPGFVLSVGFFAPWFGQLQQTPQWQAFLAAPPEEWSACSQALKARAQELTFDPEQQAAVNTALQGYGPETLFAVRSSSPEEDLAGASFAGGYETVLGVRPAELEAAVRTAFASCLDQRVMLYKQQHGFDPHQPRIAVVVQRQIASEIAGVGFSLNPLSNAYDEAVISANWGLGETVVAGLASPDYFVVDKIAMQIRERRLGAKETSIWLLPDGGTQERADARHEQWTLTDEQLLELVRQLLDLEALYGQPMDIEWAYADGQLYLLQARPITGWMPLPPDLLTAPGQPKRLYGDFTISIQGLYQPLSVMATAVFENFFSPLFEEICGEDISRDPETALALARSGRIYVSYSNFLALAGKERLLGILSQVDSLAAAALDGIDVAEYTNTAYPKRELLAGVLWRMPHRAMHLLEGRLLPEHARQGLERAIQNFRQHLRALEPQTRAGADLAVDVLGRELAGNCIQLIAREFLPLIALTRVAIGHLRDFFPEPTPDQQEHLQRLDRSLPHNVTIEMGLELYQLAQLLPEQDGAADLARGLAEQSLPPAFCAAWGAFLERYGQRGPGEIDVAEPRYREQPGMLLAQIAQLRGVDPARSPLALYEQSQHERHQAYEALSEDLHAQGWLTMKRFQSLYRVVETLGGYRETPKLMLVSAFDLIRRRVLAEAKGLVAAGRLDSERQAFDLSLAELAVGLADPALDLRELAVRNRAPLDRLAQVPRLPQVFDSRGSIFRAPARPAGPGEVAGQAISPGTVTGQIKVLHRPDEKPLLPGEILVARATDPGWTPLFVNAAAIVLEVGGPLQHGALVAREYGKPCVAGVDQATERFTDGEWVEVDGSAGIIRKIVNS